ATRSAPASPGCAYAGSGSSSSSRCTSSGIGPSVVTTRDPTRRKTAREMRPDRARMRPMPPLPALYRERLTPNQWWWLGAVAIGGSFGLWLYPVAGRPGLVLGGMAGAGVGIAVLILTSAQVEVAD